MEYRNTMNSEIRSWNKVWWYTLVITSIRVRQENHKTKASLNHTMRCCTLLHTKNKSYLKKSTKLTEFSFRIYGKTANTTTDLIGFNDYKIILNNCMSINNIDEIENFL